MQLLQSAGVGDWRLCSLKNQLLYILLLSLRAAAKLTVSTDGIMFFFWTFRWSILQNIATKGMTLKNAIYTSLNAYVHTDAHRKQPDILKRAIKPKQPVYQNLNSEDLETSASWNMRVISKSTNYLWGSNFFKFARVSSSSDFC